MAWNGRSVNHWIAAQRRQRLAVGVSRRIRPIQPPAAQRRQRRADSPITLSSRPAKRAKWQIDSCVSLSPLRGFRSVRTLYRGLTSTARRCRRCAAGSIGHSDSTGTARRPHRPFFATSPTIAVSKWNGDRLSSPSGQFNWIVHFAEQKSPRYPIPLFPVRHAIVGSSPTQPPLILRPRVRSPHRARHRPMHRRGGRQSGATRPQ